MAQVVSGVFSIGAGKSFYSEGLVITSAGTMNNKGTLIMDGDLEIDGTIPAMHTLGWVGLSAQQYIGKAMTLDSMLINATGVALGAPVTVVKGVQFGTGLVTSSAASPLIFSAGAGIGSPSDGSHASGPVQYNGTSSFTFPVGDGTYYRPVSVNLSSNGSGMTAAYYGIAAPSGGSLTAPLQAVSGIEYWTLTPVSTARGTVTLNWDASKIGSGITSLLGVLAIRAAQFSGGSWVSQGGIGIGITSTGSVTSNLISTWGSPGSFALGSTNALIAPLPLTFLGIDATLLGDGSRKIDWQVADEQQLKDYTVERSADGQQFVPVGSVPATGLAGYGYVDVGPAPVSRLFYRVRGNDLDGKATYSAVTTVLTEGAASTLVVGLMPNPVKDQLTVSFGAGMQGRYSLDLLSIDGRTVYRMDFETMGNQRFVISRPGNASRGVYVARLSDGNGNVHTYKLIFE
jgi:hypothetical protein